MGREFLQWRDKVDPQGETLEQVEESSCHLTINEVVTLATNIIDRNKKEFQHPQIEPQLRLGCIRQWGKFEEEWSKYEKPPVSGCGSSPTQVVESMMIHFWNTTLDRIFNEWSDVFKEFAPDPIYEGMLTQLRALRHGNTGCGTCGSASGCSSKASKAALV